MHRDHPSSFLWRRRIIGALDQDFMRSDLSPHMLVMWPRVSVSFLDCKVQIIGVNNL